MRSKSPPESLDSHRPSKKTKRKAPSDAENEPPRFAAIAPDKTPTSAQQPPIEIPSSTILGDESSHDAEATSTTLSATNVISDSLPPPSEPSQTDTPTAVLPLSLLHLTKKYCFANMPLRSGSKIEQKVRILIGHMSRFNFLDRDMKPGVVALHAKSNVASKLVSVVEITKREIEAQERGGKWYQYSRVSGELTEVPRGKPKKEDKGPAKDIGAAKGDGWSLKGVGHSEEPEDEEEDDEEEAFEPLSNAPAESKSKDTKLRNIPVLTIYMARVPVPELKDEFSEQTNAHA